MLHDYHRHHHFLGAHWHGNRHKTDALKRLYLSSFLHDLGLQMLSLFILFYLHQLGWPLAVVISYLLLSSIFRAGAKHLGSLLIVGLGPQKTVLIGNALRILFTAGLFALGEPSAAAYALLVAVALLDGLSDGIYFVAWDFNFASFESKGKSGRQTSLMWIIGTVTGVLAPLAGGLLAQTWGFKTSLIAAGGVLLCSVIPLLAVKQQHVLAEKSRLRRSLRFGNLLKTYRRLPKKNLLAFLSSNAVHGIVLPVWMLYLAIVVFTDQAYSGLGILAAASAVFALAISFVVGRLIDRGSWRAILRGSAWLEVLLGGLRFFVVSVPSALIHNFFQQQSSAHSLVVFQWYFDKDRPSGERLAFFQTCVYARMLLNSVLLIPVIICLLVFGAGQLEVLKFTCIALGLLGLVIGGFSLKGA